MKYTFYCNTDLKAVVGDLVLLNGSEITIFS